jgi:hypothetical protein
MVNRRELLQVGAAMGALPLVAAIATDGAGYSAQVAPPGAALPLYKVIFDRRIAASAAFGQEIGRLVTPSPAHAIDGDVTDVWYRDLSPRWKQRPEAIGGLTAYGALFCLERLAWDVGMRVVLRVNHDEQADGSLKHHVHGGTPERAEAMDRGFRRAGMQWSSYAARIITTTRAASPGTLRVPQLGPPTPGLVSWAIAPIGRA